MKRKVDPDLLQSKAAAYCATAEHCRSEVLTKLAQWGANSALAEEIADWLEEENYISESRYAEAFVADKIRFQGWGKKKIRMALAYKQVDDDAIDDALDAFPEEEYMERLQEIILEKTRLLGSEDTQQFQSKMFRFLASRGFSFSEIKKATSLALENEVDFEDDSDSE